MSMAASILTTPNRAALILSLPMASIIETSISVVDVLARLLTHPAVSSTLPEAEPPLPAFGCSGRAIRST